jgi:3-hydroxybutyryl-CoA dehydrogenase
VKVGIVGCGKMGRSIFSLFSETPMEVAVLGRDSAEMDGQNRRHEKRLRRAVSGGMLGEADLPRRLAAFRFTTSWDDLQGCDVVIETVREDFDTKVEVLRRAEEMISPQAVLTSNTSSLSITRLAERLQDPTRFCGFHFFHPVQLTSVVELITAPRTSARIVAFLRQVSRDIGRTPLVVRDRAGSCVNVPLLFHCCEALYILEQGLASPSQIDSIISGRFARLGTCEAIDAIGLPLLTDLLRQTLATFAADQAVPELCHRLIRDGRFGRYANRGVFIYRDDRPADDVPEYYLNRAQTHTPAGARSDEVGLYERLVFSMYFSLLRVAQEGLGDLGDLCFGMSDIVGLKLDPLEEMRKLGSKGLRDVFDRLRDELGPRFDCRPLEGTMATLDER